MLEAQRIEKGGREEDEVTQGPELRGFPLLRSGSASCILDMMREPKIIGNIDNKLEGERQLGEMVL